MARSIWTGALSFGLVNVPVKLFSAVEDKGVHFHQFQAGTGRRIHNKRVAEGTGREVDYEDIVKGYEVRKGEHVLVTPDELAQLDPDRSRTIDLEDVVDLDEVDPVHFDRSYYLAPANEAAAKPYALLHRALRDAGRAGIARFVMRDKQYLAAVRPSDQVLVVETMHFPDEVRDPADIDEVGLLDGVSPTKREREMADQLLGLLAADWDPSRYRDTYREQVLDLIHAKDRGEERVVEEAPERPAVTDLMEALEASVTSARDRRSSGGSGRSDSRGRSGKRRSSGGGRSGKQARREPGGGPDDRSRDELYEEATRKKVPGRSKMSKDELAAALREAS
jgi:DNA end-binding protein Ku